MAESKTAERGASEAAQEAPAKPDAKPQRKRITRRKAVEQRMRDYFEAMDRRDVGAMAEHWRDDGVEDILPVGVLRGKEELRAFLDATFRAIPDARTSVGRIVAGETSCAVEWRLVGTFDGAPFMDIEPTGSHVEVRGFDLFELEDGQIVSNTAYYDGASFARQIGMLPADGSGADRAMKSAFNAVTKVRRAVAERRGA
ncbi:MAG TPA: ester cyclase [Thermoleophilaceae bacterium]|nr:ester cyclase [Thermoleophilaceae bacterium]